MRVMLNLMRVMLKLTPYNHPYCSNYIVQIIQDLHFVVNSPAPNNLQDKDALRILKTRENS